MPEISDPFGGIFWGSNMEIDTRFGTNKKKPSVSQVGIYSLFFCCFILLMVQKSCDHQLRLVVYPTINKVLYIPSGAGFLPSTVELLNMSFVGGGNTLTTNILLDACPLQKMWNIFLFVFSWVKKASSKVIDFVEGFFLALKRWRKNPKHKAAEKEWGMTQG